MISYSAFRKKRGFFMDNYIKLDVIDMCNSEEVKSRIEREQMLKEARENSEKRAKANLYKRRLLIAATMLGLIGVGGAKINKQIKLEDGKNALYNELKKSFNETDYTVVTDLYDTKDGIQFNKKEDPMVKINPEYAVSEVITKAKDNGMSDAEIASVWSLYFGEASYNLTGYEYQNSEEQNNIYLKKYYENKVEDLSKKIGQ